METNKNDKEKYLSQTNQFNKNVPFQEINQLLTTAKNIESDIERLSQISFALSLLSVLFVFVFVVLSNYVLNRSIWLAIISCILFFASIILVANTSRKIIIKRNKEKRAFKKIVAIIQDTVPFYYKEMSVLEKANIETQIARLDIVNFLDD